MDTLEGLNIITVIIIGLFTIPILVGILRPLTDERIYRSFVSLVNNVILLVSVILAIYFTRLILADENNAILTALYQVLPFLQGDVPHRDIWLSALFITLLLLIIDGLLYLLTIPVRRYAIPPISSRLSKTVRTRKGVFKRTVGGLWQLPQSIWFVLVFSLLLSFFTGFFNVPFITQAANNSAPYQFVQQGVIQPLMESSAVKGIEIILNDSFKFAEQNGTGKTQLIKYFNGVTLDDAIQSNPDIDAKAKEIVGAETDDRQKAYQLYLWICGNITYDNEKAAALADSTAEISSGAIVAYTTGTGVCFDYSCLYIAMCRAVGLKVRFLTGLAFTGSAWGDHAWNQVYADDGWINVDTTFGSSGINYFDRSGFHLDHSNAVVQGEWP